MHSEGKAFSTYRFTHDVETEAREIYLALISSEEFSERETTELLQRYRRHVIESGFADISSELCYQLEIMSGYVDGFDLDDAFKAMSLFESVYLLEKLGFPPPKRAKLSLNSWLRAMWKRNPPAMDAAFTNLKRRWEKIWWEELLRATPPQKQKAASRTHSTV